jgi:uncharacterized membrane protein YkvA (DUF1232 family)
MKAALAAWARRAKREVLTVYFAARDPRTPWWLRGLALAIAAYALSPLDLIPDFIPVLGLLDDLLLLPLGILLILRLLPPPVLAAARARADAATERPRSRVAAGLVVAAWLATAAALGVWALRRVG